MKYLIIIALVLFLGCKKDILTSTSVNSPGSINKINFFLDEDGSPFYQVFHNDTVVIDTSGLGFELEEFGAMKNGFIIENIVRKSSNSNWEMPWGEQRYVENNYNEILILLAQKDPGSPTFNLIFRAYDDGIGFRYDFPVQLGIDTLLIKEENTCFNIIDDLDAWWIPGDWDIYEHTYNHTKFSNINAISKRNHPNLAQSYIPNNAVNTPVSMKSKSGLHLSFHEANLTDYAGMTLEVINSDNSMKSILVGSERTSYKVKRALPFYTPWRTIQIAKNAGDLIESNLIVNLNEPNKLGDIPWFKPMKYVGIWWEMHLNISSWDMASGKHGATTENAKRYIDFASKNNIKGLLVEGWNTGWEHWIGFEDREGVFDFITPYPDYNLKEVVEYANNKNIEIIMHHETSAAPRTYDQQLDTAFSLMKSLGIHSVKTGYVGKIIPKGEYHHGQWMVNHYRKVLLKAAENRIAINAHEPIKDTGLRRTYPNAISREGLRGQEFNAWASDGGNPPNHLATVAFTRMLAGPIDFTPGVFDIKLDSKYPNSNDVRTNQINTTLAHQLALYVVVYSPIQMACDLPKNYAGNPAFQFIRDVGVDWEQSIVLNGEIGEYVTIAREERESKNWFIGGITNEEPREITIDFNFLAKGLEYNALVYKDGEDAHWDANPTSYKIENYTFNNTMTKTFMLAPGGGFAISLIKK